MDIDDIKPMLGYKVEKATVIPISLFNRLSDRILVFLVAKPYALRDP
jgi:hypothetical protein